MTPGFSSSIKFLETLQKKDVTIPEKTALAREFEGEGLQRLRCWFFSHSGFTEEAMTLMKEKRVLYSDRAALDGILEHVGLRKLPEMQGME